MKVAKNIRKETRNIYGCKLAFKASLERKSKTAVQQDTQTAQEKYISNKTSSPMSSVNQ